MKTCYICKQELSEDNFYKLSEAKDGLGYECKACRREKYSAYTRDYRKRESLSVSGRAKKLLRAIKSRGKTHELSLDWVVERLERGVCEATGLKFDLNISDTRTNPYAPSIDRKDNTLGYTEDNCWLVLTGFNLAKNEWSIAVYEKIASAYLSNKKVS